VARATGFSAQTLSVLAALGSTPSDWRHGYDIAKETGLKSGTLYPILIRLADRGLVEARWEAEQPAGRPRRHLYRLSAEGLAAAHAPHAPHARPAPPAEPASRRTPAGPASRRTPAAGRRRLAAEGA
jgi:PadR family transcriptional regulator, regulatory protein PadR